MANEQVTQILAQLKGGRDERWQDLLAVVYDELRDLAASRMRRERGDHTLSPTALVNEAYLRLVDRRQQDWENRRHFFGAASQVMRQVLVDHARTKKRKKRGGDSSHREELDHVVLEFEERSCDLLALDSALAELEKQSVESARIVELRFFAGLTVPETAEVLGVSESTVERQWRLARAWLKNALGE